MNTVPDRLPRPGDEFAGYRIEREIGQGGMGIVYLGRHLMLDRLRALKLLSPELANDEDFRRRFTRESRAAASLEHPNIIPIHEAAEVEGILFLSMKFVVGSDLKDLLERQGRLDPQRTLHLLDQVANGLDAAHGRDLVHRDIKPQNIFVASGSGPDPHDHVYLLDFGLTKDLSAESQYTRTGTVMGTVHYMSPEQVKGSPVDRRTDVYSFGCVLFECLTGSVVYDLDSQWSVMNAHVNEEPPKLSDVRPDLPAGLTDVVSRALEKSREDRYGTTGELIRAARRAVEDDAKLRSRTVAAASPGSGTEIAPGRADPTVGPGRGDETELASPGPPSEPDVAAGSEPGEPARAPVPAGETVKPPAEPVMAPSAGAAGPPAAAPPPAAPVAAGRPAAPGRDRPSGNRRRVFLIGLVALLLLGVVVTALLLRGGDDGGTAPEPGGDSGEIAFEPRSTSTELNRLNDFPGEIEGSQRRNLVGEEGRGMFAVTYGEVVLGVEVKDSPAEAEEACAKAIERLVDEGFEEQASQALEGPDGEVGSVTLVSNGDEQAICWVNVSTRSVIHGPTGLALDVMNALPF